MLKGLLFTLTNGKYINSTYYIINKPGIKSSLKFWTVKKK